MIRYKVVTQDRESIAVSQFKDFSLKYLKGTVVKSKHGTLGIFCFEDKIKAEDYIINQYTGPLNNGYLILAVEINGEEKYPSLIADAISLKDLDNFYQDPLNYGTKPPIGSLCCEEVKVLE